MSNSSDTLLAFLVGATMGGIAALLLAPEKGEVTRKKIKKSVAELQERGEGVYEEAEKALEKKAQEMVKIAKHQADAVKEAISEGKGAYLKELKKS
jgi:gas vesicle protein